MLAQSILLEPYYAFRLEVPTPAVGRAMGDLQRMGAQFGPPEAAGDRSVLSGSAPVATMRGYARQVASYTQGQGKLFCTLQGYAPCHNQQQVVEAAGYDCQRDLENTCLLYTSNTRRCARRMWPCWIWRGGRWRGTTPPPANGRCTCCAT